MVRERKLLSQRGEEGERTRLGVRRKILNRGGRHHRVKNDVGIGWESQRQRDVTGQRREQKLFLVMKEKEGKPGRRY